MASLLDDVLAAHGGFERWQSITALTVHGTLGGLLRSRFPGNRMSNLTARIQLAKQQVIISRFPSDAQQAVFDQGDVRIETRDGELIADRGQARKAFTGLSGVPRNIRWDALDATYFAGYALWNYLSTPLLLTRKGVTVTELDPRPQVSDRWRRLVVSFPPDIHTHSPLQTFYVDEAALIRRHDYTAEVVGGWACAAHQCSDHSRFDGLVFPTRRRVRPRGPGGRALPGPTLVALDINQVELET